MLCRRGTFCDRAPLADFRKLPPSAQQSRADTSLTEGGEGRVFPLIPPKSPLKTSVKGGQNSHRPYGAPPSRREARTPTGCTVSPRSHLPQRGRQVNHSRTFAHTCAVAEKGNSARDREKPRAKRKRPRGFSKNSRHCNPAARAKKISRKDFLRREAASALSAVFGLPERSHTALRRDDVSSQKKV